MLRRLSRRDNGIDSGDGDSALTFHAKECLGLQGQGCHQQGVLYKIHGGQAERLGRGYEGG